MVTGTADPLNPHTRYGFTSTFEAGCSYYGYPVVLGVGPGISFSREPQGSNSLKLSSPGCAAMVASRAFGIAGIVLLVLTAVPSMLYLKAITSHVLRFESGVRVSYEDEDVKVQLKHGGVMHIIACLAICLFAPLFVCLLVWATAAGFSGGQWNGNLYGYLALIVYSYHCVKCSVVSPARHRSARRSVSEDERVGSARRRTG